MQIPAPDTQSLFVDEIHGHVVHAHGNGESLFL